MSKLSLWGWMATPRDGGAEYIVGAVVGDMLLPLVSSQKRLAEMAKGAAEAHACKEGVRVRLVRFDEAGP